MAENKVPVNIVYRTTEIQPPLFVAGSFSEPQWVPQEMSFTHGQDGEVIFSKSFDVEPNASFQYKFRVGYGDWWILDENAPTATDDAGNRNNLIEAPSAATRDPDGPHQATSNGESISDRGHAQDPQPVARLEALKEADQIDRSRTNTPEYARTAAEVADSAALVDPITSDPDLRDAAESIPPDASADAAAELAPPPKDHNDDVANETSEIVKSATSAVTDITDDALIDNDEMAGFSHSLEPVPLFAHECAGLYEDDKIPGPSDDEHQAEPVGGKSFEVAEDDFDDPTLERFPSSRHEIMATVRKVETGLNANETLNGGFPPSAVVRPRSSSTADGHGDDGSPEQSPASLKGSQHLSLPSPYSQGSLGERSASAISLNSIAEDDEAEALETVEEDGLHVEQQETADQAIEVVKEAETLAAEDDEAEALETVEEDGLHVEQQETADQAIEVVREAETLTADAPAAEDEAPVIKEIELADKTTTPLEDGGARGEASRKGDTATSVDRDETVDEAMQLPREAGTMTGDAPNLAIAASDTLNTYAPTAELPRAEASTAKEIANVVEQAQTADEAIKLSKDAEGETRLDTAEPTSPPVVTVPSPSATLREVMSPVSDEDEAVVMKDGKNRDTTAEDGQHGHVTPQGAAILKAHGQESPITAAADTAASVEETSPATQPQSNGSVSHLEVLMSNVEDPRLPKDGAGVQPRNENENGHDDGVGQSRDAVQDERGDAGLPIGTGCASEDRQSPWLKKRSGNTVTSRDRSGTPVSTRENDWARTAKNEKWFSAFFRLIFVDWIGGFVRRLCGGGRRKTT